MTALTRRTLLTGTAAAAAAGALAPFAGSHSARAAAPAAGKQAPGYYRYKVGSLEVTAVTDGARTFPLPDSFVANVKKDEVSAALAANYMDKDKMTIVFNPIVVNTGGKLVVIDTGNGLGAYAQTKGAVGQFQSNLGAAGIGLEAVDAVVISHFHGDHINGLLGADGKLAFPNAEVLVPAGEWAFWMDDGNMSRAAAGSIVEGNFKNVRRVMGALGGKVTRYEVGKEIVSGLTPIATPGHTPGHVSYTLASGNDRVLVQSDLTNHPALFVRNPGWHLMFDMNGAEAEATRRRTYDMAAAEKMLVQGFHFPFPAAGRIEKDGNGYRMVPAAWNPVL